jgi:hypothetical protein
MISCAFQKGIVAVFHLGKDTGSTKKNPKKAKAKSKKA